MTCVLPHLHGLSSLLKDVTEHGSALLLSRNLVELQNVLNELQVHLPEVSQPILSVHHDFSMPSTTQQHIGFPPHVMVSQLTLWKFYKILSLFTKSTNEELSDTTKRLRAPSPERKQRWIVSHRDRQKPCISSLSKIPFYLLYSYMSIVFINFHNIYSKSLVRNQSS